MIAIVRALTEAPLFRNFILVTILAAGVVIGLETSPQLVASYGGLLHGLDLAILWIFTIEAALKMIARSPRPWDYFRDPWNVFDFIIVAVCWIPADEAHIAAVLRLARILRVLRLVSAVPKLQLLVNALLKSLPSMGYVVLLLSIHFYIYAVVGVFLFRDDDPAGFGSLASAALTLFQVVTMEGWVDLMNLSRVSHPIASPAYFISFILLGTMIMLNLFIGVIMNGMTEAHQQQVAAEHRKATDGVIDLSAEIHQLEELAKQTTEQIAVIKRFARERSGGTSRGA
jgi:voltage-gated sodium channel